MEQEHFFSGYCRNIDKSRMVTVVTEDGKATEIDCCYTTCVHAPSCPIGKEISALLQAE